MNFSWILALSFNFLVFTAVAQETGSLAKERLLAETKAIAQSPDLVHGTFAFSLVGLKDNEPIVSYNSSASVVPASTLKLITTNAALAILGESYRFSTQIQYDGTISSSGTLDGNIYIKGGGDPTLDSELFIKKGDSTAIQKFAGAVKAAGIKKINGKIIGDASFYPENTTPSNWIWEDIGNYYGAAPSGLTYKENQYKLFLSSGSNIGDSVILLRTEPELKNVTFINKLRAGGKGDNAYIYGSPYSPLRIIEGTIPAGKTEFIIKGSFPDPAQACAEALDKELRAAGVNIEKEPGTFFNEKLINKNIFPVRKLINVHQSPTLDKIIYWTNFKSHNLFAEHLLLTIGLKAAGTPTIEVGIEGIKKYLKEKGINISGLFLADGSGLSRINTLTTQQLNDLLRIVSKEAFFPSFLKSIPAHLNDNIKAKSGYMERVRSYGGYITTKKGETLAFAMIANNYECTAPEMRKKMERLMQMASDL